MRMRTKVLLALLGAITLLLTAAPWLIPLSQFIPAIEARAQERLKQPVKVSRLQLFLLPLPRVVASDVVVGEHEILRIGSLTLTPSVWHLLGENKQLTEIRLDQVLVKQEALLAVPSWRASGAEDHARVQLDRVVVRDAQLVLRAFTLRNLAADISFDQGAVREILVRSEGDRLRVTAVPESKGTFRLRIAAHDWKPPIGPAILFRRLDATALLTERSISSHDFSGSLYDGTFRGPVSVSWKPAWSVSGELALSRVDLQPLAALFSKQTGLSGRLSANPRFSAIGPDARGLLSGLELQSEFTVQDGVLQKIDLQAAARNPLAKDAGRSGSTRFDRLSGYLELDPEGYHFSNLKITSGLVSASGEVSVAHHDQALSGRVDAGITGTGELVAVPLTVGGTLKDPSVRPTKTAVAAMVAGSVLLPGIGTAVGLKASQLTARLFGGTRRRADTASAGPAPATSMR
jgi:hypothetical protein